MSNAHKPDEKVVAVTGATGLVGAACVAELVRRGYHVRAAVRDPKDEAKIAHLKKLGPRVTFIKLPDITKADGFAALCAGATDLLHVASPVGNSELSADEYVRQAVSGTMNALEAAQALGVEHVVVTCSMASVCGSQTEKDPAHVWTETDFNDAPGSNYSLSKTRAEEAAWKFAKMQGLTMSTIHPALVIGQLLDGQAPCSTMKMLLSALNGELKAAGGLDVRAFGVVDIGDVARAHCDAMEKDEADGERYLLTSNDQFTVKELVDMAVEYHPKLKETAALEYKDDQKEKAAAFKPRKPSSNNAKACKLLGVDSLTSVKDAVAHAVDAFIACGALPPKE